MPYTKNQQIFQCPSNKSGDWTDPRSVLVKAASSLPSLIPALAALLFTQRDAWVAGAFVPFHGHLVVLAVEHAAGPVVFLSVLAEMLVEHGVVAADVLLDVGGHREGVRN